MQLSFIFYHINKNYCAEISISSDKLYLSYISKNVKMNARLWFVMFVWRDDAVLI